MAPPANNKTSSIWRKAFSGCYSHKRDSTPEKTSPVKGRVKEVIEELEGAEDNGPLVCNPMFVVPSCTASISSSVGDLPTPRNISEDRKSRMSTKGSRLSAGGTSSSQVPQGSTPDGNDQLPQNLTEIRELVGVVESSSGPHMEYVASVILKQARRSSDCKDTIREAGGIPKLLKMLRVLLDRRALGTDKAAAEEGWPQAAEEVCSLLQLLCADSPESVKEVQTNGGTKVLLEVLKESGRSHSALTRNSSAALVAACDSNKTEMQDLLEGLRGEISSGLSQDGGKRSVEALAQLCAESAEFCETSVSCSGMIAALVDAVESSPSVPQVEQALQAIGDMYPHLPVEGDGEDDAGGGEAGGGGGGGARVWGRGVDDNRLVEVLAAVVNSNPAGPPATQACGILARMCVDNLRSQDVVMWQGAEDVAMGAGPAAGEASGGVALRALVSVVRDHSTSGAAAHAAAALGHLTYANPTNQDVVREAGAIRPLVQLLVDGPTSSAAEQTARAVANLCDNNPQNLEQIVECGGIQAAIRVLESGPELAAVEQAAAALANLCFDSEQCREEVHHHRGVQALVRVLQTDPQAIGARTVSTALANICDNHPVNLDTVRECGGVAALVGVLWTGPDNEAAEQAAGALANMCFDSAPNRDAVREAGGVDALVSILQASPRLAVAETVATALANLCYDNQWNRSAVRVAGGIPILVQLVTRYSELSIAEQAAAALANLCYESDQNRLAVSDAGGVQALQQLQAAQPGSSAAAQAAAALSLLQTNFPFELRPSRRPSVTDSPVTSSSNYYNFYPSAHDVAPSLPDSSLYTPQNSFPSSAARAPGRLEGVSTGERGADPKESGLEARRNAYLRARALEEQDRSAHMLQVQPLTQEERSGVVGYMEVLDREPTSQRALHAAEQLARLTSESLRYHNVVRESGGVGCLVRVVGLGPLGARAVEPAAAALANICDINQDNRDAVREAGGVAALVTLLLQGPDLPSARHATAALANLCVNNLANQVALRECGGLPALLQTLNRHIRNCQTEASSGERTERSKGGVTHRSRFNGSLCDSECSSEWHKGSSSLSGGANPSKSGGVGQRDCEVLFRVANSHNMQHPQASTIPSDRHLAAEQAGAAIANMCAESEEARDAVREAGGVSTLVTLLQVDTQGLATCTTAMALRHLCLDHPVNQAAVREAGGLVALVGVLCSSPDQPAALQSAGALANLCGDPLNREKVREAGGLHALVAMLCLDPASQAAEQAARALATICQGHAVNCGAVVQIGAVEALVAVITEGHTAAASQASLVLAHLTALIPHAQTQAVKTGALPALAALLTECPTEAPALAAAAALVNLACDCPEAQAQCLTSGCLHALLRVCTAAPACPAAGEAAAALANICYSSAQNQAALVQDGGVEALALLMKADPRGAAAHKAAAALANLCCQGPQHWEQVRRRGGVDALVKVVQASGCSPAVDFAAACLTNMRIMSNSDQEDKEGGTVEMHASNSRNFNSTSTVSTQENKSNIGNSGHGSKSARGTGIETGHRNVKQSGSVTDRSPLVKRDFVPHPLDPSAIVRSEQVFRGTGLGGPLVVR